MSTNTAEAETTETTGGDGPLLDLTDAGVKKFIKQAKARGYVTMDELNKVLPSEEVTSEAIEDTLAMLSEMGVNVVEAEEDAEGGEVAVREETAVVESVKAASEVYSPVTGTVVEANEPLANSPITVNEDPEGAGWFCRIEMSDPAELEVLMDEAAYKTFVEGL